MGALKSRLCSKGHLMKDPNLYYRSNGNRECRKCRAARKKAANKAAKKAAPKKAPKDRSVRQQILRGAAKLKKKIGTVVEPGDLR